MLRLSHKVAQDGLPAAIGTKRQSLSVMPDAEAAKTGHRQRGGGNNRALAVERLQGRSNGQTGRV